MIESFNLRVHGFPWNNLGLPSYRLSDGIPSDRIANRFMPAMYTRAVPTCRDCNHQGDPPYCILSSYLSVRLFVFLSIFCLSLFACVCIYIYVCMHNRNYRLHAELHMFYIAVVIMDCYSLLTAACDHYWFIIMLQLMIVVVAIPLFVIVMLLFVIFIISRSPLKPDQCFCTHQVDHNVDRIIILSVRLLIFDH